jgi:hypothetical protein
LITFQDLDPYNYDLFYFVSCEVTKAIRFSKKRFGKKRLDADTYCPDVYLVTYYSGTEVVQSLDWLADTYQRHTALDFMVKSKGWQQRGQQTAYKLPVPAFEMRMLLELGARAEIGI